MLLEILPGAPKSGTIQGHGHSSVPKPQSQAKPQTKRQRRGNLLRVCGGSGIGACPSRLCCAGQDASGTRRRPALISERPWCSLGRCSLCKSHSNKNCQQDFVCHFASPLIIIENHALHNACRETINGWRVSSYAIIIPLCAFFQSVVILANHPLAV